MIKQNTDFGKEYYAFGSDDIKKAKNKNRKSKDFLDKVKQFFTKSIQGMLKSKKSGDKKNDITSQLWRDQMFNFNKSGPDCKVVCS